MAIVETKMLDKFNWIYLIFGASLLLIVGLSPSTHDYALYLEQWEHIAQGHDPWQNTLNAYGPFYTSFAYIAEIHPKLPALVFMSVYLLAFWLLCNPSPRFSVCLFGLINPLFLIFGLLYNNNETLLAGLLILALWALEKQKDGFSGMLFALACAFKFSAGFLFPLFFIRKGKINFKNLLAFSLTIGLLYLWAFLRWGDSFLIPFQFGMARDSRLLSVFRFIRGTHQPLAFLGMHTLDQFANMLMLLVYLALLLFIVLKKIRHTALSACIIMLGIFSFYKVGNHQYFITTFALFALFVQQRGWQKLSKPLKIISISALCWFGFTAILYHFTRAEGWGYGGLHFPIREWIGGPTFLSEMLWLFFLMKEALGNVNARPNTDFTL